MGEWVPMMGPLVPSSVGGDWFVAIGAVRRMVDRRLDDAEHGESCAP